MWLTRAPGSQKHSENLSYILLSCLVRKPSYDGAITTCPKRHKYHLMFWRRRGISNNLISLHGVMQKFSDTTAAFASLLYHLLRPVRLKPSIKHKRTWFQSLYSQLPASLVLPCPQECVQAFWRGTGMWGPKSDTRWCQGSWHPIFFTLIPTGMLNSQLVELQLIFQLHGQRHGLFFFFFFFLGLFLRPMEVPRLGV